MSTISRKEKDFGILKVAGKIVVRVSVDADGFNINWVNEAWGGWAQLQESIELIDMIKKGKGNLAKSKAKNSKGEGKGSFE